MDNKIYQPFPELVDSSRKRGAWTVRHADLHSAVPGSTNKRYHVMHSPHGPEGLGISRHELMHVAHSPTAPPKVNFDPGLVQAVEDARLNMRLARLGLPPGQAGTPEAEVLHREHVEALLLQDAVKEPYELVKRSIACLGQPDLYPTIRECLAHIEGEGHAHLAATGRKWLNRLADTFGTGALATFRTVREEAERLAHDLGQAVDDDEPPTGGGEPGDEPGDESGDAPGRGRTDLTQRPMEGGPSKPAERHAEQKTAAKRKLETGGVPNLRKPQREEVPPAIASKWTEIRRLAREAKKLENEKLTQVGRHTILPTMEDETAIEYCPATLVEAPLTVMQPKVRKVLAGGSGCAVEGLLPSRMDRFAIDGAVFQRRRPGTRLTVLVDVSGSMSLSAKDIEKACIAAGGRATIATYCGDGARGELRIVAKGMKRASLPQLEPMGYGNCIDMPALAWLAKQPGKRLWVCDGYVTGRGDTPSRSAMLEALLYAEKHRIDRLDYPSQIGTWLTDRGVRVPPPDPTEERWHV